MTVIISPSGSKGPGMRMQDIGLDQEPDGWTDQGGEVWPFYPAHCPVLGMPFFPSEASLRGPEFSSRHPGREQKGLLLMLI